MNSPTVPLMRKPLLPRSLSRPSPLAATCWLLLLWSAGGCAHQDLALPKPGRGPAAPLPVASHQATAEEKTFWNALAATGVIYIAETHNDDSHHAYQFDVLRGLRARGVSYTVGWEMFEAPQQGTLDAWQRGELTTEAMLEKTSFQSRWGKLSAFYEKMLRWNRQENVENLALNAPGALSTKLAHGEALGEEDRALIPTGFRPVPGGFEHFSEQMGQNPHAGASGNEGLKNFYRAQLLWDQTMAERIVGFLRAHPEGKLIVLLGRGHVEGGFGVPAFVRQKSAVKQLVLYPGESGSGPQEPGRAGRLAGPRAKAGAVRVAWVTGEGWARPGRVSASGRGR